MGVDEDGHVEIERGRREDDLGGMCDSDLAIRRVLVLPDPESLYLYAWGERTCVGAGRMGKIQTHPCRGA